MTTEQERYERAEIGLVGIIARNLLASITRKFTPPFASHSHFQERALIVSGLHIIENFSIRSCHFFKRTIFSYFVGAFIQKP